MKATPIAMYEKTDSLRRMIWKLRFQQSELRAVIHRMEEMSPLDPMRYQITRISRRLQTIEEAVEMLQRTLQQCAEIYSQCEERNVTRSRLRPRYTPVFPVFTELDPNLFRDILLI